MKTIKYEMFYGLVSLFLLLNGCAPALTNCIGEVSIDVPSDHSGGSSDRFVIISFWDYPGAEGASGKIVVNDVIATYGTHIIIDFPYAWAGWTGTPAAQRPAPAPGIIVLHRDYAPAIGIGGTEPGESAWYGEPRNQRDFRFSLSRSQPLRTDDARYRQEKGIFERLAAEKTDLAGKLDGCKYLTSDERAMVMEKIMAVADTPVAR